MQIQIHSHSFKLTKALKKYAETKLKSALHKSQTKFNKVVMRLSDINGPRGGVDKRCQIHVMLTGIPDVIISNTDEDMYFAIDRAADRAGFAVDRRISRRHANKRHNVALSERFSA